MLSILKKETTAVEMKNNKKAVSLYRFFIQFFPREEEKKKLKKIKTRNIRKFVLFDKSNICRLFQFRKNGKHEN